jgi:TPR repeat protein
MAPGRDWIIDDIDDDTVATAEAAAKAAVLSVDEWMRRAIVETYRREALTPPATVPFKAADSDTETGTDKVADSKPAPAAPSEPEPTRAPPPSPEPSPVIASAPSPEPPAKPAATTDGPPAQPYRPISPGTSRVIRVGRLAVGTLLLLVVGAIAWDTRDMWLTSDAPVTTAEPDLDTLPTEQVPVRPAHEAPDPQETERALAERQATAETGLASNEAAIVDETTVPEAPAAAEEVAAAEAPAATEEANPAAEDAEPQTTVDEAPASDPAAVPESEVPAPAATAAAGETDPATMEIAVADPFAADPYGDERVPEGGTVRPIVPRAEPAAAAPASPQQATRESQVATRTPAPATPDDDIPESVAAFVEAAEAGDPDAQHDLALIYVQGLGVPRDPEAAAHWFDRAAQQGNANAQYNLGVMYEQGLGVPQDRIESLLLYLTAAEQGHVAAQYNAGLAYAEGKSIPRDFAEAHRWFSAAAEQGLAEAQYNLGIIYENGLGRVKDDVAAFRHYSVAAQSGHQEAAGKLAALSARLTPAQRTKAEQAVAAEPPAPGSENKDRSRLDRGGIREVQQLLKTLGYDTGVPDGLSGGRTTAAIRQYQQSAGLIVDGQPTAALLEHLRDAAEQ